MEIYKKSVSILFMIAVTLSEAARKIEDCEVISLRNLEDKVYSTFNESIRLSILPDADTWETSALISDSSGNDCKLTLRRLENSIKEELQCRRASDGDQNNTYSTESPDIDTLMKNTWIDILLDTEIIAVQSSQKALLIKLIVEQPGHSKIFDTKLRLTPLQSPLKIQWEDDAQVDLVFNCQNKDCLVLSRTLVPNPDDPKTSFFVQPGDSFKGLDIILEPSYPKIESLELPDNGNRWRNITLTEDVNSIKILIDGTKVKTFHLEDDLAPFEIKAVKLRGNGLLTWCDLRQPSTGDMSNLQWSGWVSGGVLVIVLIIIILVVYIWRKHSKSEEKLELITSSSPAHMADRAPVAPPTGGVSSPYPVENVSETIPELREGNRGSSHDSENSIYEAYVP